jgi:hypothetical protein
MKIDLFLKLDGIDGESTDAHQRNEIGLLLYRRDATKRYSTAFAAAPATPDFPPATSASSAACTRKAEHLLPASSLQRETAP